MKKQTAIHLQGKEIDIMKEGSSPYFWYQVCEVLHRNERGRVDYYRRLFAYPIQRYQVDALKVLQEIQASGEVKEYKPPKETYKQKYVIGYSLCQVTPEWGRGKPYYVPPVTRKFYRVEEIDDPYKLRQYQVRTEYRGRLLDGLQYADYFNREKIEAIIKQLNQAYWKERAEHRRERIALVDRRVEREDYS